MHRVGVDRQHGDRTERNADAHDVGNVKRRFGDLQEIEIRDRAGEEERRFEFRPLLVHAAEAQLVAGRVLEADGERDVADLLDLHLAVVGFGGRLHGDGAGIKVLRETERECRFAEALVARRCADRELRMDLPRAGDAEGALANVERGDERIDAELEARGRVVRRVAERVTRRLSDRIAASRGEEEVRRLRLLTAGGLIERRRDDAAALVVQRLVVVDAEGKFFDREHRAGKADVDAVAVVRKRRAHDVGERAARREELLLLVVAQLDGKFRLAQNREAGGIRFRGRGIVGETEERAAHAERARARIAEVELQAGERFDVDVLCKRGDRDQK